MRVTALVFLFTLTACQSPVAAPQATFAGGEPARESLGGAIRAHLYASVGDQSASIERFPIVNGIPQEDPDRVYPGYGGLLAVGGDGTLYAGTNTDSGGIVVDVFPPKATKPARKIIVPNLAAQCDVGSGGATAVSAVAADANAYLFVAIYTFSGGVMPPRKSVGGTPADSVWPCEGVAVYAPNAKGKARPTQVIRYGRGSALLGLAVDAADNLYVADYPSKVDEFSNAITSPTETRVFRGRYIGFIHAICADPAGDIFIASTNVSYKSGRIDRYAPGAKGRGAPSSVIDLPSGVHLLPSIAEHGRVLYVDDTFSSVDLYYALKNGDQGPFNSRSAPNVSSIAIGP